MATQSQMIQLYVEQELNGYVSIVYGLEADAFLLLDPTKDTVVREFASEKWGGVIYSKSAGLVMVGIPSSGFVQVSLLSEKGDETDMYGPSSVASPPTPGIGLAVLTVSETGYGANEPVENIISVARGLGAHAYVDQTDP